MDEEEEALIARIEQMPNTDGLMNYTNILDALYEIPQEVTSNDEMACTLCLGDSFQGRMLSLACHERHAYHINCVIPMFNQLIAFHESYPRRPATCSICRESFLDVWNRRQPFVRGLRNVECVNFWFVLNSQILYANRYFEREVHLIRGLITGEHVVAQGSLTQATKDALHARIEGLERRNRLNIDITMFSVKKFENYANMDMTTGMEAVWTNLPFCNSVGIFAHLRARINNPYA